MAAFDAKKREHEGMAADQYNDDHVYKRCLNEVRVSCGAQAACLSIRVSPGRKRGSGGCHSQYSLIFCERAATLTALFGASYFPTPHRKGAGFSSRRRGSGADLGRGPSPTPGNKAT